MVYPLGQPVRIGSLEFAAKYVVFSCEQGVHHAQAKPPAFVEAGHVETVYVGRKIAVDQPEARPVTQRLGILPRVAVDLGSIPPGRGDVLEHRISVGRIVRDLVVGDSHLGSWLRPLVALPCAFTRQRDDNVVASVLLTEIVAAMVDPVVYLKLYPGRGQNIEGSCRDKSLTSH